ncbi:MAG: PGF-CTERM-anchored ABC transporter substrate-binding protein [Haloarculaceae archaeon]
MRRSLSLLVAAAVVLVVAAPVGAAPGASPAGGVADRGTAARDCSFPVSRTDATGTAVTIDSDPSRVVVLQPSAAQVMWEINASDEVVGMPVKYYTEYLNGSTDRVDVVADDGSVNVERVVAASPDLVLAPNIVSNETVTQLREDGLTVYKFSFGQSLSDIYAKTELVGRLTGNCAAAERRVETMKAEVTEIRDLAAGEPTPEVLFYMPGNYTAGTGTFVHEAIETAGGENVAAEAGISGYKPISKELVVKYDPEVVVVQEGYPLPEGGVYASTFAVRHDQVVTVDRNYISQPAPRVTIPMRAMAETFASAEVQTPTQTATQTGTGTPAETMATRTTAGSGPGFGVVAALVAALAAALLAARSSGRKPL